MKNIKRHIIGRMLKSATCTVAFVLGSLSGGCGQQFHVQSQYILDLILGFRTHHQSHEGPVLSSVHHN